MIQDEHNLFLNTDVNAPQYAIIPDEIKISPVNNPKTYYNFFDD